MKTTIFATILVFVNIVILFGQEETQKQDTNYTTFEFTLKDGTKLVGQLMDQNKEFYLIKTANFGTMKVGVGQVVSIVLQGQKIETILPKDKLTIYNDNQFGFKYFLINTAIPAEPKKWYYTNQYVAFSSFTYGISKHVSTGISFFTFVPTTYFSPNLKITINPESKLKFAINGQYYALNSSGRNTNFGIVQGLLTSGDSQNNFTFGLSKIISGRGVDDGAIVTFGFVKKASPKLSVISENHVIIPSSTSASNAVGFLSAGLRFDRQMHAFDLGIYVPTSGLERNVSVIPYLGFNVKMNK
jgi:hypothetical protein